MYLYILYICTTQIYNIHTYSYTQSVHTVPYILQHSTYVHPYTMNRKNATRVTVTVSVLYSVHGYHVCECVLMQALHK